MAVQTDPRFTPELLAKINTEMAKQNIGDLAKWNATKSILTDAKIAYQRNCMVTEVMVSRFNRDGLGLNAFNVHQALATVTAVGTDIEHLHKAIAFELPAVGDMRSDELASNQRLIAGSDGLLAELTGNERLCWVACSHFTAACEAILAGCRTCEESLKDSDGNLNRMTICREDEVMERILDHGFTWTMIPALQWSFFLSPRPWHSAR